MKTQIVEATNDNKNWGKFLVARFDGQEWGHQSVVSDYPYPVLMQRGWGSNHRLVVDIETGEGALFLPGGHAKADLDKHRIWVCPLFEPFLAWWYEQWPAIDVGTFPPLVELDAEFQWAGYRRTGTCPNCAHPAHEPSNCFYSLTDESGERLGRCSCEYPELLPGVRPTEART